MYPNDDATRAASRRALRRSCWQTRTACAPSPLDARAGGAGALRAAQRLAAGADVQPPEARATRTMRSARCASISRPGRAPTQVLRARERQAAVRARARALHARGVRRGEHDRQVRGRCSSSPRTLGVRRRACSTCATAARSSYEMLDALRAGLHPRVGRSSAGRDAEADVRTRRSSPRCWRSLSSPTSPLKGLLAAVATNTDLLKPLRIRAARRTLAQARRSMAAPRSSADVLGAPPPGAERAGRARVGAFRADPHARCGASRGRADRCGAGLARRDATSSCSRWAPGSATRARSMRSRSRAGGRAAEPAATLAKQLPEPVGDMIGADRHAQRDGGRERRRATSSRAATTSRCCASAASSIEGRYPFERGSAERRAARGLRSRVRARRRVRHFLPRESGAAGGYVAHAVALARGRGADRRLGGAAAAVPAGAAHSRRVFRPGRAGRPKRASISRRTRSMPRRRGSRSISTARRSSTGMARSRASADDLAGRRRGRRRSCSRSAAARCPAS